MIIAIPSVTQYINNSRKSAYVDTAKEIIAGARTFVNDGKLEMFDTNATYYIPIEAIGTENGQKSPYGDFEEAYVVVTYNGSNYTYYWISVDETGQGVKNITRADKLDEDDIESDIKTSEITDKVTTVGIGNRTTIKILDDQNDYKSWKTDITLSNTSNNVSEEGASGGSNGGNTPPYVVNYMGKTKDTVDVGDIVKIENEEFYVVTPTSEDPDGNLVLLAHYNLKVGEIVDNGTDKIGEYSIGDAGYGLQSSIAKGWTDGLTDYFYGVTHFSSDTYWNGKVGSSYLGETCNDDTSVAGKTCAYVYYDKDKNIDSSNIVATYVNLYKTKLEEMGATIIDARLLKIDEIYDLGCGNGTWNCNNAPAFVSETSYYLGSASDNWDIWSVSSDGLLNPYAYDYYYYYGVRPVIVI